MFNTVRWGTRRALSSVRPEAGQGQAPFFFFFLTHRTVQSPRLSSQMLSGQTHCYKQCTSNLLRDGKETDRKMKNSNIKRTIEKEESMGVGSERSREKTKPKTKRDHIFFFSHDSHHLLKNF